MADFIKTAMQWSDSYRLPPCLEIIEDKSFLCGDVEIWRAGEKIWAGDNLRQAKTILRALWLIEVWGKNNGRK